MLVVMLYFSHVVNHFLKASYLFVSLSGEKNALYMLLKNFLKCLFIGITLKLQILTCKYFCKEITKCTKGLQKAFPNILLDT